MSNRSGLRQGASTRGRASLTLASLSPVGVQRQAATRNATPGPSGAATRKLFLCHFLLPTRSPDNMNLKLLITLEVRCRISVSCSPSYPRYVPDTRSTVSKKPLGTTSQVESQRPLFIPTPSPPPDTSRSGWHPALSILLTR